MRCVGYVNLRRQTDNYVHFVRYFQNQHFRLVFPQIRTVIHSSKTPFFRTDPLLYHKYENMLIFQKTYIHFVAQETSIIRKLFIFNFFFITKVEIANAKVVFLLELVIEF